MAAFSVEAHGGKRNNSGRKRRYEGLKNFSNQDRRLYLSLNVFLAWREAKTKDVATVILLPICCRWSTVEGKNAAKQFVLVL